MNVYPLIMTPSFRHGSETPWGGHALKELFGKDSPEDITGESLEVSALPGLESRVANGELAGITLRDLLPLWGKRLTGSDEDGFPLLLKFLDTRQPLSVQVHPDDAYALSHEGKPGKSEAHPGPSWFTALTPTGNPCVPCWMRESWKAASAGRKCMRVTCFTFPPVPFMPWVPVSAAMKSSRPAISPIASGTGAGSERMASPASCTSSRPLPFQMSIPFPSARPAHPAGQRSSFSAVRL